MLRTTLVFFTLAVIACQAAPDDAIINQIYDNVVVGEYEPAISKTKELYRSGKNSIIKQTVNKLLVNSQRNALEYAYKLYSRDAQHIVENNFPIQFRMILAGNPVKLINKRDNLAMKLGVATDSEGDRTAYGDSNDKTSQRVSWNFQPFGEDNRVYFKIMHTQRLQFLKLAISADSDGEHKAYGSSGADSFRNHWYLQPTMLNGELLFFIFNREYNHALKLGRAVDDMGDRQVWGHNGHVVGSPDLYGWNILPF